MVVLLTLGLYPSSGGPIKSIRAFQDALAAEVISWVDPEEHSREQLVWEHSKIVTGNSFPVLKQLQIPLRGETVEAERLVAQAQLVSVHSFWRWHIEWIHRVCMRHGVPYWYVPHGSLDPYVLGTGDVVAKRFFLSCIGRSFFRDAATIIYSTARERDKAIPVVGHDRAEVIHWPLEQQDFQRRDPAVRQATRAMLGIAPNSVCFLYLGRLSPMKRPLQTIEAFARSSAENTHLIMLGNDFGVSAEECRRVAANLGVATRTHVIGPAYGDQKRAILDASDIYVSLSQRENFNYSAAEAMAAGLATILSPGNDLAPNLVNLAGVYQLSDMDIDTAAAMMDEAASIGCSALAAKGAQGVDWAVAHLSRNAFRRRVYAVANKYARTSNS